MNSGGRGTGGSTDWVPAPCRGPEGPWAHAGPKKTPIEVGLDLIEDMNHTFPLQFLDFITITVVVAPCTDFSVMKGIGTN